MVLWQLPKPLMKELDEMEKINAKLSAAVEEVTLEHCKKNEVIFFYLSELNCGLFTATTLYLLHHLEIYLLQIIKHHSQEVGLQRRVFVDFFCNPERLRTQVRELTARVRALQVS